MKVLGIILLLLIVAGGAYFYFSEDRPTNYLPADLSFLMTSVPTDTFVQPGPGDRVRLELQTGNVREGEIIEITDRSVTVTTHHGEVTYAREQIAGDSRRLLFRADYDGAPEPERPRMILDPDIVRYLQGDPDATDPLGLGERYQYVIVGTNALFLFRP